MKIINIKLDKALSMFSIIKKWEDQSKTIKEARETGKGYPLIVEIIKFIILFWFLEFAFSKLLGPLLENTIVFGNNVYLILMLLSFAINLAVYLVVILKIERRNLRSIGFSSDNKFSSYASGLAMGFVIFVVVLLISIPLGFCKFEGFYISSLIWAIPFFLSFAIQSMTEEVMTRGWMMVSISRKNSASYGILFSALIFSLLHISIASVNLLALINIFLFGILFALLFLRYDNIWVCGGIHAAWNFTQGYIFGFNVSGIEKFSSLLDFSQNPGIILNGGNFGPEAGIITTVVVVVAIILTLTLPNGKTL